MKNKKLELLYFLAGLAIFPVGVVFLALSQEVLKSAILAWITAG